MKQTDSISSESLTTEPEVPKIVTTFDTKKLEPQIQEILRREIRGMLDSGGASAQIIVNEILPAFTKAVLNGDKEAEMELGHQLDGNLELQRIRAAKSAQRVLRAAVNMAISVARLAVQVPV